MKKFRNVKKKLKNSNQLLCLLFIVVFVLYSGYRGTAERGDGLDASGDDSSSDSSRGPERSTDHHRGPAPAAGRVETGPGGSLYQLVASSRRTCKYHLYQRNLSNKFKSEKKNIRIP